jgi:V/A-type H+-transporting ATPase subunit D
VRKNVQSGVRPTRIELLKLRRRELLAQKGHDLLEEKRDALIIEFFRMVDEFRERRNRLDTAAKEAYRRLDTAQMTAGNRKLQEIACAVPRRDEIAIEARHVMGVSMPLIRAADRPTAFRARGYGFTFTSTAVDEAADGFLHVYEECLRVAEMEGALHRLATEIARTKRRVNALESIVIPRLRATEKYIEAHLEELEREDIFRRKKMKTLLQRKAEITPVFGAERHEGPVG